MGLRIVPASLGCWENQELKHGKRFGECLVQSIKQRWWNSYLSRRLFRNMQENPKVTTETSSSTSGERIWGWEGSWFSYKLRRTMCMLNSAPEGIWWRVIFRRKQHRIQGATSNTIWIETSSETYTPLCFRFLLENEKVELSNQNTAQMVLILK